MRRLDLARDFIHRRNADRPPGLAARDQGRQGGKRRASAPMPVKQNTKCPGADIVATQEPEPIEALALVEGGEPFKT